MAAIDCPNGVRVRDWMKSVDVQAITLGRDRKTIVRPFLGFRLQHIIYAYAGSFVDIPVSQITSGNGSEKCNWKQIPDNQFAQGWETDVSDESPGQKVIIGLIDKDGNPIISLR